MNDLDRLETILQVGQTTTAKALEVFDELDTVNLEFMIGRWKGRELHTNHPMDGLLETFNWYGKEFINEDRVHPLLFLDGNDRIIKVDPNPLGMDLALRFSFPKNPTLKPVFELMTSLLKTDESKARIRMMEYRGKVSATMIYDYLPINDVFRKISDRSVLGLMDFKAIQQPFFFILNRE